MDQSNKNLLDKDVENLRHDCIKVMTCLKKIKIFKNLFNLNMTFLQKKKSPIYVAVAVCDKELGWQSSGANMP